MLARVSTVLVLLVSLIFFIAGCKPKPETTEKATEPPPRGSQGPMAPGGSPLPPQQGSGGTQRR